MRSLNIKDFTLADFKEVTSEFISNVFKSFLDNFLYLLDAYQKLNTKHEAYKIAADKTFEFFAAEYSHAANPLIITGYNAVAVEDNVSVQRGFGLVTLDTERETSLIPLVNKEVDLDIINLNNDDDGYEAVSSARIYKNGAEDEDLRNVLDETGLIWSETSGDPTMTITVILPTTNSKIAYLEIFPYGGTSVNQVTFKGTETDETRTINYIDPDTDLFKRGTPFKIFINKDDFNNEVEIELAGFADGGEYFYSLGYIRAYQASYIKTGSVTYNIGNPGNLSQIEIIEPIIYPTELHDAQSYPIDIIIRSTDGFEAYNTTDGDSYPLEEDLELENRPGGNQWQIKFILNRTNGITPVFRKCVLTQA